MLFSTLILIPVDGEHDGLQQRVDLGHGNKAAEVGNVPRLRLEEEEQVSVFLRLLVVGKEALLKLSGFVEVACNLVLLRA